MYYNELYAILKEYFDTKNQNEKFDALNLTIDTINMSSKRTDLLYGSSSFCCDNDGHEQIFKDDAVEPIGYGLADVDTKDYDLENNKNFDYYILKRADIEEASGAIIFFHGLNEKKWDKYLPWAYEFAQKTNKAVILFPIAFHMGRAEAKWSNRYQMLEIAKFRQNQFKENSACSYVNAAISSRLEAHPQRIFWSGFQTYSDVITMIEAIKAGNIKGVAKEARFDLFGYSIGSFLSMILKMANPSSYFEETKLFCFCGGMTIDRMYPISKYIMDARSAIKMQTTFAELLSSDFKADSRLAHFQNNDLHKQESWFKVMLRYNYFQKQRENRIQEMQDQIKVYVLEKDEVAPPIEALNTFKGGYRTINVDVEIKDYPFDYTHVIPFPLTNKNKEAITEAFNDFVNSACRFYTS